MKKIIIIFIITIIFLISISYFFLFEKNNNIENNIVKITKTSEISNIQNNPLGIFGEQKNIGENTFNGFFIDKNTIITVEHGLNNNENLEIIDNFGNNYYGEIISRDKKNDFAIIKTNKNFKNFSKIKLSEKINNGQKIKSISFEKIKAGEIKKIENNKIFSDINFESGESGSVLIDKKNNLIGINIGNDLLINMGISTKIKEIIDYQ